MNTLLSLLIGAAVVMAAPVAQAASLSLVPSSNSLQVGESLSLDLVIDGLGDHTAPSLGAFDVDVSYDPALLNLSSVSFGLALGDINLGEALAGDDTPTPGTTNIWELSLLENDLATCLSCIPPYLSDLQGTSFTLATLVFSAAAPGTAVFGLAPNAMADGFGDNLDTTVEALPTVQVTAVPVPAAIWLFGSALCGVGAIRRRTLAG